MTEYITEELIKNIASNLSIRVDQVNATLKLLSEDCTIPFIARYRKEVTGLLDEDQIRAISKEYEYGVALNKRKEDIIRLITEKGMMTDELLTDINNATKLITLEDIYRPYKEKKKTHATVAIKNGLKPLAEYMMTLPVNGSLEDEAQKYLNENVKTVEDAIQGAKYIIAEEISDNKDYRTNIREKTMAEGLIVTKKKKDAVDELATYQDYYEYTEKLSYLKTYKTLAINRAEREKVITVSIEPDREKLLKYLERKVLNKRETYLKDIFLDIIEDSFDRLIFPSIEREIRSILTDDAEDKAIKLFGDNLENLLLQAPLKDKRVLGIDPAFRTGCKIVALDETGKVLDKNLINQNQKFPGEKVPEERIIDAAKKIVYFVKKYNIDVIAIGNGTASRETERFVAETIRKYDLNVKYIIVSESGASVYSASEVAQEEFPDYHVEERSAVSIGRRIQDPLSELVKIDPKAIGVGQYQHDVSESKLSDTLDYVVLKAVNEVGVNINTASKSLLQYVSGLNKNTAKSIVDYRESNGSFKNRKQILKVPKIGDKVYTQAVGFLRINDGSEPFDKTSIHPESYDVASNLLKYLGFTKEDLGKKELSDKIASLNIKEVSKELDINEITLTDLLKAFAQPLRDPRDEYPQPALKTDILNMEDLHKGMELEGTVRNITDFGAFIDIGLHESGLVHISKMATRRINHPSEIVKVGEIVKVWVLDVDMERKRIQLSMLPINN